MLKSRNTTSNYQKTSQARKKYSLAGVGPCHSQEGAVVLTGTKILTPSQVILGSGMRDQFLSFSLIVVDFAAAICQ